MILVINESDLSGDDIFFVSVVLKSSFSGLDTFSIPMNSGEVSRACTLFLFQKF